MSKCYHCGERVAPDLAIVSEIAGEKRAFCCNGCQMVAELIQASDLTDYYRIRNRLAPRIDKRYQPEHWQAYDLPEIAQQYLYTHPTGEYELHLYLDGIHCSACAWLIKSALKQELGIDEVQVNTTTSRAEIRWRDQPLSRILHTLSSLGYTPNLYTPDAAERQSEKMRNQYLLRLVIAGLASMQTMMLATGLYNADQGMDAGFAQYSRWLSWLLTTPVMFYSGFPFLQSAWRALLHKQVNMDLPIAFGALGAYLASAWHTILGKGEIYFESVGMFIFALLISRFIEFLTRRRARLSEYRFARLLPEAVEKIEENGEKRLVPLPAVQKGDYVYIRPAQTIAVDGVIVEGETRVDESMLTGESIAQYRQVGDKVLAGSHNLQSPISICITQTGQQTTLAGINRLIARASQYRSPLTDKSEKLAQQSILVLLLLAVCAYVIWHWLAPERALDIALAVLVATCPCALSLAIPTTLTGALNHANQANILIKNADTLYRLPSVKQIVFDKTGTLTQGHYQLITSDIAEEDRQLAWSLAKSLQQHSSHPIAWHFTQHPASLLTLSDIMQHSGAGVLAQYQQQRVGIGSRAFIAAQFPTLTLPAPLTQTHADDVQTRNLAATQSNVYLVLPTQKIVQFVLADPLRAGINQPLAQLRAQGLSLCIASGDQYDNVIATGNALAIDTVYANLSAKDKLELIEQQSNPTLMIGDGINDAPSMAAACVSVAVNQANPLSQTQADVVLLQHSVEALPFLFTLARRAQQLIRQNIIWAALYNASVLPLALFGYLTPWIAAIGMSLSSIIVVINALRIRKTPLPAPVKAPIQGVSQH